MLAVAICRICRVLNFICVASNWQILPCEILADTYKLDTIWREIVPNCGPRKYIIIGVQRRAASHRGDYWNNATSKVVVAFGSLLHDWDKGFWVGLDKLFGTLKIKRLPPNRNGTSWSLTKVILQFPVNFPSTFPLLRSTVHCQI